MSFRKGSSLTVVPSVNLTPEKTYYSNEFGFNGGWQQNYYKWYIYQLFANLHEINHRLNENIKIHTKKTTIYQCNDNWQDMSRNR